MRKSMSCFVHFDQRQMNPSSDSYKREYIYNYQCAVPASQVQTIYPIQYPKFGEPQPSKHEDFKMLIQKHKKTLELLAK